jgi:choline dehydrogenase-like flavoprotein
MALDPVDVCIVGSGAGGGPMALELGRAGINVVVLEKGPFYQQEEFVHDELLMSRRAFFMPFPWEEPHLVRYGPNGKFEKSIAGWTANCVGGGTVHMSGYFYRLKPVDFRLRSALGKVPGANVFDWPIRYEDLARYYDKAEEELGVSGDDSVDHPFKDVRNKPFPLPPLDAHPICNELDKACHALGYHPFPTARGIISRAYRGRAACSYCALCGSYGCEMGAKSSTHASLIPVALATGHVEVRSKCMAKSIEVDKSGKAKSVVYLDPAGATQEQPAKVIIVACTAIESARLLLQSRSSRFPKGLANGSGQVGKNLVFSSFGESRAVFRIERRKKRWPWLGDRAPFVQRSVQDFYWMKDDSLGFRKGGTLGFVFAHPNPIYAAQRMAGVAESGSKRIFGKELKDALREYRDSKILQYELFGEFLPTDGTYVSVEESTKDKYGLPVASITIDRHPMDSKMTKFLVERGEEILTQMQPDDMKRIGDSGETTILQGGTCRFGNDPATAVLDKDCRAHEVSNLYVVDSSFMPTSGGVPPTLTIVANSFRVADVLIRRMKHG